MYGTRRAQSSPLGYGGPYTTSYPSASTAPTEGYTSNYATEWEWSGAVHNSDPRTRSSPPPSSHRRPLPDRQPDSPRSSYNNRYDMKHEVDTPPPDYADDSEYDYYAISGLENPSTGHDPYSGAYSPVTDQRGNVISAERSPLHQTHARYTIVYISLSIMLVVYGAIVRERAPLVFILPILTLLTGMLAGISFLNLRLGNKLMYVSPAKEFMFLGDSVPVLIVFNAVICIMYLVNLLVAVSSHFSSSCILFTPGNCHISVYEMVGSGILLAFGLCIHVGSLLYYRTVPSSNR